MQYRSITLLTLAFLFAIGCSSEEEKKPGPGEAAILAFTAEPSEIEPGGTATLSWRTRNATSLTLFDGEGRPVDLGGASIEEGSVQVGPETTTTYTLQAKGPDSMDEREVQVRVRRTPEIVYFAPNRSQLSAGEQTLLLWEVKDAIRIVVRAGDEVLFDEEAPAVGSLSVAPEKTTTYVLEALDEEGDGPSATTAIQVVPVIDGFEAVAEGPVAVGTPVPLRWSVRGAERVLVVAGEEEWEAPEEALAEGETELPAPRDGIFRLHAFGGGEEVEAEASVDARPLPLVLRFDLPAIVSRPEDAPARLVLGWEVRDAESLVLTGLASGPVELEEAEGELELEIEETTTLTLHAENAVGSATETRTVEVVEAAAILSFHADRPAVLPGEPVALRWEVKNAASVELDRDGTPLELDEGSTEYVDRPERTSVYTLTARDRSGQEVRRSLEIVVADALLGAELAASPEAVAEGDPITLSWKVTPVVDAADLEVELRDGAGQPLDLTGKNPRQDSIVVTASHAGTHTFELEARALGATVTARVTVVVAAAPTILLASNPPALDPLDLAEEIEIAWTTENATSLALFRIGSGGVREPLDPIPAAEVESGSMIVPIEGATLFEAEATSAEGVVRVETFLLDFAEPVIHSFTASAIAVAPGATVRFDWDTSFGVVEFDGVRAEPTEATLPLVDLDELGATALTLSDCGGECAHLVFPPGFAFPYFGDSTTRVWVNQHGFVSFEAPDSWDDHANPGYLCLDDAIWSTPTLAIAPYWSDLWPDLPGSGLYWAYGNDLVNRQFVVLEWRDLTASWDDGTTHFQLVLWDDGTFDFRYGAMVGSDANGVASVVGHRNLDPYVSEEFLCDEVPVGGLSNRAWRHYGPPPARGSAEIQVQASGDYELCVRGYAGQTVCETIAITVAP